MRPPHDRNWKTTTTTSTTTTTTTTMPPATTTTTTTTTTTRPPDPLEVDTELIEGGRTGGSFFVLIRGTGGVAPYRWSLVGGSMPTGLSLTQMGLVRGVPTEAGEFSFTVRLEDDRGEATEADFTMSLFDPLAIDTAILPVATVGYSYATTLEASGGTGPYTWTVATDVLPEGLGLDPAGTIAGIPDGSGTTAFTVRLEDAEGRSVERGYQVEAINPLVIISPSLPGGTTGVDYAFSMDGSGGRPPHTWSVPSGSLPPGLEMSVDGLITGTPTVATGPTVVVRVTDVDGRVAAFPYVLSVVSGTTRQEILARGGMAVVDIVGSTVNLVSAEPADGFTAYTIHQGPSRVQVHFIGPVGISPSWLLCEGSPDVSCSFD